MKRSLILAIMIIALAPRAQARLGYTKEQCDQQYGKPVETFKADWGYRYTYAKNGIRIEVPFTTGRDVADRITYEIAGEFSDEQVAKLLELNNEGGKWTLLSVPKLAYESVGAVRLKMYRCTEGGEASWWVQKFGAIQRLEIRSSYEMSEERKKTLDTWKQKERKERQQLDGL